MLKASARFLPLAMVTCAFFSVSACSQVGKHPKNNWEQLTASRSVAKVSNISSLIQPGMN